VVDHLSRLERNVIVSSEKYIEESFSNESVMIVSNGTPPWYADFANYVVCGIHPDRLKFYQRKRFLCYAKNYFCGETLPCTNHMTRKCVSEVEVEAILDACHVLQDGGNHSAVCTTAKVLQSGYYCPTLYQDVNSLVKKYVQCQNQ